MTAAIDHTDDHRLVLRWCADQHRQGLADETVTRRRAEVRNLLDWLHARNVELLDAEPAHIEAWVNSRKIGAQARYSYISYAAAFYGWAVWMDLIDTAPTDRVRRPKLPHHLPRPISDRDLATALERAEPRTKAMIALGAFAGLRCKEIAGVRREDIIDGLDLRLTQQALGHASPTTTALYTALVPGQASEIITRLDLPDDDDESP